MSTNLALKTEIHMFLGMEGVLRHIIIAGGIYIYGMVVRAPMASQPRSSCLSLAILLLGGVADKRWMGRGQDERGRVTR
jgi:hypothetical protein